MAIGTTGVIGVELPMALIRGGIPNIQLSKDGGAGFARAILTTDRVPKSVAVRVDAGGRKITIGGCAKGSGMIHPNMATLLAYLTTDAAVDPSFLRSALKETVDDTFNMVTIDGDMSTNDTVMLFANGEAGNDPIAAGTPAAAAFTRALYQVCGPPLPPSWCATPRARQRYSPYASTAPSARRTPGSRRGPSPRRSSSSRPYTANDPNWGRVIAAAGYSGASIDVAKVSFFINNVVIMEAGTPISFHRGRGHRHHGTTRRWR